MLFIHFCSLLVILLLKSHHQTVAILPSISKCKKIVLCLTEKNMCVFDKLPLDMSYSTVGCELNANDSTIYIYNKAFLNRNSHKTGL